MVTICRELRIYIVKFGFSVAIARLLSPEDYGMIGMIVIFIALSAMIT
ncbi:MAG: oligosaccharide flippase family protein, partial [Deltaproteobacteria bacterium]|nr:oligosaccharide flippase family protein [Deltaproteobacteria bacterium]